MSALSIPEHARLAQRKRRELKRDWRCTRCYKLLGQHVGERVRLRFTRGHQYDCTLPVSAVCRCCGTLNELLKLT